MIALFEPAAQLQDFCDRQGWQSCFIGGIAVLRWGETRVTRDIDLTILTGFGDEDRVIDALLSNYPARIPNAREFPIDVRDAEGVAIRNRGQLNWNYIEEQLEPLVELKHEPEILRTMAMLREL